MFNAKSQEKAADCVSKTQSDFKAGQSLISMVKYSLTKS